MDMVKDKVDDMAEDMSSFKVNKLVKDIFMCLNGIAKNKDTAKDKIKKLLRST